MSKLPDISVGYICTDENALASCTISLDEEHNFALPQKQHDDNCYGFGKIGSHNVVCCTSLANECASSVADMIHSFPSITLLVLVSGNAGAVPRGDVHVGDVVVAQKLIKTNHDSDLVEMRLPQASGLLATTDMITGQQRSLDEDIVEIISRNRRWGGKCQRPAGDDIDKLDKIFTPRHPDEPASVVHRDGLVISNSTYPKDARSRDSVASRGTSGSASVVCFDHGQTAGLLPLDGKGIDAVSVLGVSNYCDKDSEEDRGRWMRYSSIAAASCARKIVMSLATETEQVAGR